MNENPIDLKNGFACPLPMTEYKNVLLAHGGGGKLSHQMIQRIFASQFKNDLLDPLHDGAMFSLGGTRCAFSTDSYVIDPLFFPGGDIGILAVNGTVNDLAMCGAHPLYRWKIYGASFFRWNRQQKFPACNSLQETQKS
jgi:hypothetical protein